MPRRVPSLSLEVGSPSPRDEGSTHGVVMYTGLLRAGCYIPEAWEIAIGRTEDPSVFSFAAAGCSNGAEVDSVLAVHKAAENPKRVRARGFDANALAVEAARRGIHTVLEADTVRQQAQAAILEDLGFGVSFDDGAHVSVRLQADANPLREGHDVEFERHDITEPLPAGERYDLILVNNVLRHILKDLGPAATERTVHNLGAALNEGGIISFSAGTLNEPPRWAERTITQLDEEFGLRPVFSDTLFDSGREVPVMFGRT